MHRSKNSTIYGGFFENRISCFSIALGRPARRTTTTTHKVKDISHVNWPSKFQRISIYERQDLVNLERRGWPVTPWWRGQGGTPNLIKTFWITALRALGSTEWKLKASGSLLGGRLDRKARSKSAPLKKFHNLWRSFWRPNFVFLNCVGAPGPADDDDDDDDDDNAQS